MQTPPPTVKARAKRGQGAEPLWISGSSPKGGDIPELA